MCNGAVLEPLVEACRPYRKTQHHHLRRTMEAIIWRRQNGAKWCAVPAEYGPWWMAAQTFILGQAWRVGSPATWCRRRVGGWVWPSWTAATSAPIRRPPMRLKGGSRARRDAREALGRSRGGYGTKARVIADGAGCAFAFQLALGQAHELPMARSLLSCLPKLPTWMIADRA
jgi:transposase